MNDSVQASGASLAALRRLARPPAAEERCDLCRAPVPTAHQHLFQPESRRLACACDACAVLANSRGSARYHRVPPKLQRLDGFQLSDDQWDALAIPIELAFFTLSDAGGPVSVVYPSPAGATESTLGLDPWNDLAAANPVLTGMAPFVEALLVNRMRRGPSTPSVPSVPSTRYFLVSIDECYRLVGVMRRSWRGLSGGDDVWREIGAFFDELDRRAGALERPHA